MAVERILIISSPIAKEEFRLSSKEHYLGRSDANTKWQPDIDFEIDRGVSRKHARLFFNKGNWWIEDLGSSSGTFVNGRDIRDSDNPTQILPGIPVRTGFSIWLISSSDLRIIKWKNLVVHFQVVPAINYALHECKIGVVSNFTIHNPAPADSAPSAPFNLTLSIPSYSRLCSIEIPSISAGSRITIRKILAPLMYEILVSHSGKRKARIEIGFRQANESDRDVFHIEDINVTGFYEWLYAKQFRITLACFILSTDMIVQRIVESARETLNARKGSTGEPFISFRQLLESDEPNKAEHALAALYTYMKNRFEMGYVYPPNLQAEDRQRIRVPEHMISQFPANNIKGKGEGTCLDITLLFAAFLENIHFRPLVIIVQGENCWHSIVGCWEPPEEQDDPIISDYEVISNAISEQKLTILETTGFTDRWKVPLDFEDAVTIAESVLDEERFVFALDVSEARKDAPPLQYSMEPDVLELFRRAELIACKENEKKEKSKLQTGHILLSLLIDRDPGIIKLLEKAGGNVTKVDHLIDKYSFSGLDIKPCELVRTVSVNLIPHIASQLSKCRNLHTIDKESLLFALAFSDSRSVDSYLEKIGTTRRRIQDLFKSGDDGDLDMLLISLGSIDE